MTSEVTLHSSFIPLRSHMVAVMLSDNYSSQRRHLEHITIRLVSYQPFAHIMVVFMMMMCYLRHVELIFTMSSPWR